ncbi:MAG: 2-oxo acid dehydrogenase subunit E2 [Phycisphaerales bacterium]|nr:2-oxo acid dehydrogenase subunit E2 [Phycisphaerales bacterium]
MGTKDFKLPDLGEGVHEGQIVRVMVAVGDQVREDQPLMEVETDKAAVVIPSPFAGVVETVHVRDGQMVHVGDVMVSFGAAGAEPISPLPLGEGSGVRAGSPTDHQRLGTPAPRVPSPQPSPRGRGSSTATSSPIAGKHQVGRKPASPAVRKLARELGVDIETVNGSGPGGRIERVDVEMAASSGNPPLPLGEGLGVRAGSAMSTPEYGAPPARLPSPQPSPKGRGSLAAAPRVVAARVAYPAVPESVIVEPQGADASDQYGSIKRAPLTQARKTIATVMSQSWSTIPHATDFDDADVTELDKLRQGYAPPEGSDRKITLLAFVVRAVARALQRFPDFNAAIDIEKNEITYKRYFNIAIGVHTERGLVPMVIRDADQMSIPQISDALAVIGEKARTATFAVNDTRGGTYTISNAGAMGGSRYSTPIITPPQVAVLAVGRTRWRPWVIEGDPPEYPHLPPSPYSHQRGLAPRLIMPLSHSIDHRVLDGGQEVQFMQQVIGDLQNPARLLL